MSPRISKKHLPAQLQKTPPTNILSYATLSKRNKLVPVLLMKTNSEYVQHWLERNHLAMSFLNKVPMNLVKKVEVRVDYDFCVQKQVEQVPFSQVALSKPSQSGPGSLDVLLKKDFV